MKKQYQTSDFDYTLPESLIAQYPLEERAASRLLSIGRDTGSVEHLDFHSTLDLLQPGDLLVKNNTRVIPARIYGRKATGGKLECLVERVLSSHAVLAHLKVSKSPGPGTRLYFADDVEVEVIGREGALFQLQFLTEETALDVLHKYGEIPLPPYMKRSPVASDSERYQTVFGYKEGAVAAPTASLHFDQALLDALVEKGVQQAEVTLHVGAGTFQPVRTESLQEHVMHQEYMEVSQDVCDAIAETKQRGGRIVALGTTVVRCLETAAKTGELAPYKGETQLFITPGYQFQCVDALITNFHLPKSTLLMLVCAFGGYSNIMSAYSTAIEEQYRFFSYGDAMFIA
jgi:S-adenosylmethionine:tRNA ribosyltransferase-isomerase